MKSRNLWLTPSLRILPIVATLLLSAPLFAQVDTLAQEKPHLFTVGASHWTRGEWRKGALPAETGSDQALFVMSSTSLKVGYRYRGLEVMVVPKHSGVWGQSGGGSFSLDEGWVSLRHTTGLFAKIGRQKLAYDDQRIIGDNDWAMATSRHDVLKLGFENTRHQLHLLLAFNQNAANTNEGTYYIDGGQPYKSMQTAWYHFDPVPQLGTSLIFMNTGMQDLSVPDENTTSWQQLYGGFFDFHPKDFKLQAAYYRQCGKDEFERPIDAWMGSVEAVWQASPQWRLNTGYFHMSGDDQYYVVPGGSIGMALKTEVNGFNPVFGSHHQFYGAMDFFYVTTYYGGNTPGLQDFHLGVQWSPAKTFDLGAEYHYLATSIQVENAGKTLGHELELSAAWKLTKDVSLQAGYSFMKGTETMEVLKRSSEHNRLHWGWLMLSVTPEFFSYKY